MKKIFSVLAAAIIALSFTSCGEKGGATGNGFKITVSDVTATTAHIAIEPNNKEGYWGCKIYLAEAVAKYTVDTIAAYEVEELASYIAMGATMDVLKQYGYVYQGNFESDAMSLPAKTNLTIIAFEVKQEGQLLVLGNVATKTFTTKDVEKKGTIALENMVAEYNDYTKYGIIQIIGEDSVKGLELGLAIEYGTNPNGTFTLDDCYEDGEYYWNYIYNIETEDIFEFLSLELTGSLDAEKGIYTFSGKAIAENEMEYTFTNIKATEFQDEEAAPAKVTGRKFRTQNAEGLVKQTLSVKRFVK